MENMYQRIDQRIWIFVIREKSIRQAWKKKDIATKTELDTAKTASKKVVHKTVKVTVEMKENKIAEKIVKQKPMSDLNSRKFEYVTIPSE